MSGNLYLKGALNAAEFPERLIETSLKKQEKREGKAVSYPHSSGRDAQWSKKLKWEISNKWLILARQNYQSSAIATKMLLIIVQ